MRKILIFEDGDRRELTPISFEEFDAYGQWSGANDTCYREFLRHNKFHELDSFNSHALINSKLILEPGEPIIDWDKVYGADDDESVCALKSKVMTEVAYTYTSKVYIK